MKGTFRKFLKQSPGQKGFTLVELLVVVAILGILAALAVPSLVGLTANAETQARKAEYSTVQTAMDAMLAKNSISAVTATAAGTAVNNMTAFPVAAGGEFLSPNYIRSGATKYYYSTDGIGNVIQWDTATRTNQLNP